mmetsp:Transcript_7071/g.20633  ORF Transcript_7071/g.20633 Transcript_7071/m.20633 type:complete len:253 (-) Transcript_7071:2143-2901(-)
MRDSLPLLATKQQQKGQMRNLADHLAARRIAVLLLRGATGWRWTILHRLDRPVLHLQGLELLVDIRSRVLRVIAKIAVHVVLLDRSLLVCCRAFLVRGELSLVVRLQGWNVVVAGLEIQLGGARDVRIHFVIRVDRIQSSGGLGGSLLGPELCPLLLLVGLFRVLLLGTRGPCLGVHGDLPLQEDIAAQVRVRQDHDAHVVVPRWRSPEAEDDPPAPALASEIRELAGEHLLDVGIIVVSRLHRVNLGVARL